MSVVKLAADFEKEFGSNDEESSVAIWLDTGFKPLNRAISGDFEKGLPVGRIVEMYGDESCGKTAIATSAMAACQKAGGIPMFFDHERSFQAIHAEGLGLDLDKSRFIFRKPETFEQSITMALKMAKTIRDGKMIADDAPLVAVFDSLASMVPKSKIDKDSDGYSMHDNLALAAATSAVFPALSQLAEKYQMLMLFLNQTRTKPGVMFGDPTTTPGGKSPKFYASVRIQLGRAKLSEKIAGSDKKKFVGQEITANVIKNKISRPFETAKWQFRFREDGSGYFDVVGSTIDYLCEEKILKKGTRITWTNGKTYYRSELINKIINEGVEPELFALLES